MRWLVAYGKLRLVQVETDGRYPVVGMAPRGYYTVYFRFHTLCLYPVVDLVPQRSWQVTAGKCGGLGLRAPRAEAVPLRLVTKCTVVEVQAISVRVAQETRTTYQKRAGCFASPRLSAPPKFCSAGQRAEWCGLMAT